MVPEEEWESENEKEGESERGVREGGRVRGG